jgi:methylmalonyl-CoA mutase C-terminal domain/subunit
MPNKRLRILIARFGDESENVQKMAHSCCEAGFEVVYTNLQDPEAICRCALEEAVDHIGIITMPGATVQDFARLFDILSRNGLSQIPVTGADFFPEQDINKIKQLGAIYFYSKNSIYEKIEKWREEYSCLTDDKRIPLAIFQKPQLSDRIVAISYYRGR